MRTTLGFEELRAFVTVVRFGSFTRATDALGTQKAHLSRVVTRLEAAPAAALDPFPDLD
jgi:LysR family transcriptional regulator, regulator for bpeEF and oprC